MSGTDVGGRSARSITGPTGAANARSRPTGAANAKSPAPPGWPPQEGAVPDRAGRGGVGVSGYRVADFVRAWPESAFWTARKAGFTP